MTFLSSVKPLRVVFTVMALFSCFFVSGQDRGVNILPGPEQKETLFYESSHALLIGFSDYNNGWNKLPGVAKDIQKVEEALKEHGFEITKHMNLKAIDVNKAFKDFINLHGYKENTRLLFYIAGHGHTLEIFKNKKGYLVPVDAPLPEEDKGGFLSNAISMDQIETYAKTIGSLHTLFIFDACFSGSIFSTTRANVMTQTVEYQITNPVRQFIASGDENQTVPDKSIFVDAFIEGINGMADMGKNPDGFVTATELGLYVQEQVTNISKKAQTPQYGKINDLNLSKGDFLFRYNKEALIALPVVERVRIDTFLKEVIIRDTLIINNFEGIEDLELTEGQEIEKVFKRGFADGKFHVIGMNMDVMMQRAKINAGENALAQLVQDIEAVTFQIFKKSYENVCEGGIKKRDEKKIDEGLQQWAHKISVKAVNSADISGYRHSQNNGYYFYHAQLKIEPEALAAHMVLWAENNESVIGEFLKIYNSEVSAADFTGSLNKQIAKWQNNLSK